MTLLLIGNNKTHNYDILCPELYAMSTWGQNNQEGIEKKRKNWYFTFWKAGNDYINDYYEEIKINVLLETNKPTDIINYVDNKCRGKMSGEDLIKIENKIIDQLERLFKGWIELERWIFQLDKTTN